MRITQSLYFLLYQTHYCLPLTILLYQVSI
nr:MAG TPA: hypothetical protein [Herelleviridae sp.]